MSVADEIEKLNQLRQSGAITEEEYQNAKDNLLKGKSVSGEAPSSSTQITLPANVDDKTWALIIHLSQFCGFLVPFAGLIVPIVLWQVKKNDSAMLDEHGRIVANWVVTALIAGAVGFLLSFVLIGIPLLIILGILCIVFPIIGAIKANEGVAWKYPGSLKLFG